MQSAITMGAVERLSDTLVRVSIRVAPGYSIDEPETVQVSLPASLLSSQEEIVAQPSLRISAQRGTARLSGPPLTEALLVRALRDPAVAAPLSLAITLEGDAWAPGVGGDTEATRALLAGIASAQDGAAGWNAVVQPALSPANVTVANGTLHLALPQLCLECLDFSIEAPEAVSVVVPAEAVLSQSIIYASGTLVVNASAGVVRLVGEGASASEAREAELAGPEDLTLTLELADDYWHPDIGDETFEATAALLSGIVSVQDEEGGWNAVVQPGLRHHHLTRVDDATLRLALPQFAEYAIDAPDTIFVAVPYQAVLSRAAPTLAAPFVVAATPGIAILGGSLLARAEEVRMRRTYVDLAHVPRPSPRLAHVSPP